MMSEKELYFRNLLKKYMKHVLDEEHITYIRTAMLSGEFSEQEIEDLKQIEHEVERTLEYIKNELHKTHKNRVRK